jgi:hypothetical protein
MNERVNFSKRGQMIMNTPSLAFGKGSNFGPAHAIRPSSDTELKLAQQSLYLLKAKMEQTRGQTDKNFAVDNRKGSTSNNVNNGLSNPNYRRIQTFNEEISHNARNNEHKENMYDRPNPNGRDKLGGLLNRARSSDNDVYNVRDFQKVEKTRDMNEDNNRLHRNGHQQKEQLNSDPFSPGNEYPRGQKNNHFDNPLYERSQNDKNRMQNRGKTDEDYLQRDHRDNKNSKENRNGESRNQNSKSNFQNNDDDRYDARREINNDIFEDAYNPPSRGRQGDHISAKNKQNNQKKDNPNEQNDENEVLISCSEGCGRKFNKNSLIKHEAVCRNVFLSKNKVFDMTAKRLTNEKGELIVNLKKIQSKANEPKKKREEGKIPKWKLESAMLRNGLKGINNKNGDNTEEAKLAAILKDQECINCPSCNRNFSEKAGNRHIPLCAERAKNGKLKLPVSKNLAATIVKDPTPKLPNAILKEPITKRESLVQRNSTISRKESITRKVR